MVKQAPTAGRLITMVAFALSCFGLLLFLWVAFGGPVPLQPKGYRVNTSFNEATQLAKEADVRISGVSVGKVKDVQTDPETGLSKATFELDARYAPLPSDAKATLRQKTLLGETYVELTPGSRDARPIPEDGELPPAQVSPTVELDEIFRAFDPKTRRNFQNWMQSTAVAVDGRGRDISDAIGNLSSFAQDTDELLQILNAQKSAVRSLSANTGEVFGALSEQRGQLAGLITNSNRVFEVTARRNEELQETFRALPAFEKEATTTVRRLTDFAERTDPLITQLRPAARELSPTLTNLSGLAPDLKALFRDLDPVITASKRGLPATQRFLDELRPVLAASDPTLAQLNPILSFLGLYTDELNSFFANTVASTQATTQDGVHYLRTTNPLNLESLAVYDERLGSNRSNPYAVPRATGKVGNGILLPVFSAENCGRENIPDLVPKDQITPILGQDVADTVAGLVQRIGGSVGTTGPTQSQAQGTPPCVQQGKYEFGGKITQYPQVNPASDGSSRSGE
ncbi:MAG: MCE family protein [Solirubrobacterales bacterium]|nr:MCE family protein [Solirubrobacterales bacterium]